MGTLNEINLKLIILMLKNYKIYNSKIIFILEKGKTLKKINHKF